MSRTSSPRRARERRLNRWLMAAFALLLLFGVVMQIAMMSRLSDQSKRVAAARKDILALNASAENLDRAINAYHDLDRIAVKAKQLGMQQPDQTQLRVVNLPALAEDTSTRSADNSGAEEMID